MALTFVPDEQLHGEADYVKAEEVNELWPQIKEMAQILVANNGAGLAAVQVGINKRLFLMRKGETDNCLVFFNATYKPMKSAGKVKFLEGCLSYPNKHFETERWKRVKVSYDEWNFTHKKFVKRIVTMESIYSIIMQHEIDHQYGITLPQIGKEVNLQEKLDEMKKIRDELNPEAALLEQQISAAKESVN